MSIEFHLLVVSIRKVQDEYSDPIMPTRDELKALIDQLPEDKLRGVRRTLELNLNLQHLPSEMEQMKQRSREYKNSVLRKFQENRKPGTLGAGTGSGFVSSHNGVPFGRQAFHYWDDKALVHQSRQTFDGPEIEIMERLSFSADRTMLVCSLEISSGGHTVQHQDGFPISSGQPAMIL